jgi:hypothetical protein
LLVDQGEADDFLANQLQPQRCKPHATLPDIR